jgi:hypothetical protein
MAWTLTLPPDDGLAGYVLATDGSGNTTWVDKAALGFTQGSVPFIGAAGDLAQDNANFFFDNTNNRLGLITSAPDVTLDVGLATDAIAMPKGTTLERPNPAAPGYTRFNITTDALETFDGTDWVRASQGVYSLGSVLFADANGAIAEDNSNFFWDNTTKTLALGEASTSDGQLKLYSNLSANSVSIFSGNNTVSWNLILPVDDGAAGQALITDGSGVTSWGAAGATITDTTAAGTNYPVFANANTGTFSTAYVTSTKYTFNPSTGQLTAPNMASSAGIHLNAQAITASYTIPAGYNGLSAGPVVLSGGVTVTVAAGGNWAVV